MSRPKLILAAALLGAFGVALGAFGAHALKAVLLERGSTAAWQTAVQYNLLHAVALLALASWRSQDNRHLPLAPAIASCWVAGVVLFSGSIYLLAPGWAPGWVGPVTPIGGLLLISGWVLTGVGAIRSSRA